MRIFLPGLLFCLFGFSSSAQHVFSGHVKNDSLGYEFTIPEGWNGYYVDGGYALIAYAQPAWIIAVQPMPLFDAYDLYHKKATGFADTPEVRDHIFYEDSVSVSFAADVIGNGNTRGIHIRLEQMKAVSVVDMQQNDDPEDSLLLKTGMQVRNSIKINAPLLSASTTALNLKLGNTNLIRSTTDEPWLQLCSDGMMYLFISDAVVPPPPAARIAQPAKPASSLPKRDSFSKKPENLDHKGPNSETRDDAAFILNRFPEDEPAGLWVITEEKGISYLILAWFDKLPARYELSGDKDLVYLNGDPLMLQKAGTGLYPGTKCQ
jgi:hypothetical protein